MSCQFEVVSLGEIWLESLSYCGLFQFNDVSNGQDNVLDLILVNMFLSFECSFCKRIMAILGIEHNICAKVYHNACWLGIKKNVVIKNSQFLHQLEIKKINNRFHDLLLKIIYQMESQIKILIRNFQLLEYWIFTLENTIAEKNVIKSNLKYKNKSQDGDIASINVPIPVLSCSYKEAVNWCSQEDCFSKISRCRTTTSTSETDRYSTSCCIQKAKYTNKF